LVRIRDQLANGVGIHHAGLLPIAKEIVEILFSRGLCKVLFATETFAMGVNMPTRTVVFSSIRKHDGRDFRHLLPGEYTQMSGRAGRRGLDSVGTVILYCESDIHEEHVLQKMILGMPTLLVSQFRLTYNMILNLLRGEGFGVEDMMRRSFAEFDSQRDAPARRSLLKRGRAVMRDMEKNLDADLAAFPQLAEYWESFKLAVDLRTRLMVEILTGKNSVSVLQPGRILVIEHPTLGRTLAILIRSLSDVGTLKIGFRVFALALTSKIDASLDVACSSLFPPFASMNTSSIAPSSVEFLDVEPSCVVAVVRSRANATDLPQVGTANPAQTRKAFESLSEQFRKLSAKLDCYDLVNELRIRELEVVDLHQRLQSTIEHMLSLSPPSAAEPLFATVFPRFDRLMRLKDQLREIELSLLDENLSQMPDFDSRVKVLQELGYIDTKKTVQLKGKVACELNSCDCLMVTELIFDNFLTPLAPEEIICVLSSFVCQEKNVATSEEEEEQKLQFIRVAEQRLVSLATRLGELQVKYGIDTTPADYAKSVLNFSMMTVAYEWACGVPFGDICKMTSILEGSIVRTIVQLEQACREVRDAARVIGDFTLFTKMEQCSIKIKRDIVFAGSLYVV
jgi:antiviral helicase SKI2